MNHNSLTLLALNYFELHHDGMVWSGMAWDSMECDGIGWNGMAWDDNGMVWSEVAEVYWIVLNCIGWYGMACVVGYGLSRFGLVWAGIVWYWTVRFSGVGMTLSDWNCNYYRGYRLKKKAKTKWMKQENLINTFCCCAVDTPLNVVFSSLYHILLKYKLIASARGLLGI